MSEPPSRSDRRSNRRLAIGRVSGWFRLGADFHIVDLSLDGFGVESTLPLQIGRTYSGAIEWEGERIQIGGRVVWSALVRTTKSPGGDVVPIYHSGIQFLEAPEGGHEGRRRLIERATTYQPGDRLFGRYEALPDEARVELDSAFRVRTLSRTGMLIEAAEPLQLDAVLDLEVALDGEVLRCQCRVASVETPRELDGQMVHPTGVEFVALDPAAAATLDAFLAGLPPAE